MVCLQFLNLYQRTMNKECHQEVTMVVPCKLAQTLFFYRQSKNHHYYILGQRHKIHGLRCVTLHHTHNHSSRFEESYTTISVVLSGPHLSHLLCLYIYNKDVDIKIKEYKFPTMIYICFTKILSSLSRIKYSYLSKLVL